METIIGPEFPNKVIPLIENAKNKIHIVVFDWRWYPSDPANPVSLFNQALVRAARRGVRIFAIVNQQALQNQLKNLDIEAKVLSTKNLVHAKMLLIDDETAVIGSHNYSQSAFTTNHEISIAFTDAISCVSLLKYFQSLWQL